MLISGACRSEQQLRLATPRMHASEIPTMFFCGYQDHLCRYGIDDDPGLYECHCKVMDTNCCSKGRQRTCADCYFVVRRAKADRLDEYFELGA